MAGWCCFFEFLRRIGYRDAARQHLPISLTSPNAIDPVQTFTAFLISVVAGARRFAHTSLPRADPALHTVLGILRFPTDDTIRKVQALGQGQCQRFFSGLWSWQLERLPERASGYSLDLDSTVFVSPLPCVVKSSFVALYSVAGHRLVVHLSSSWGGLQRRILLLENVLA